MTTVREPGVRDAEPAARLRAAMVAELREMDAVASEPVAAALASVPRHVFAPGQPLEAAYAANNALVIKRGPDGGALSSLSATHIQAVMLEQAQIKQGMRVLEIGSGGYNAALIQELVGAEGQVTSVDIDPEIVARARGCLNAAGYDRVDVVLGDAEEGLPAGAYDRIIVTAGAWDIPPAWIGQLSERGRIVVPLRMRAVTRSIAFDRDGAGLTSHSYRLSGFVPMQGTGAFDERGVQFDEQAAFRFDDDAREFDLVALREALHAPRLERWSGAAFDLPDELELFLVTTTPQVAMLHGGEQAVAQGLLAASAARGVPAIVSGGSFAYRTKRPNEATGGFESGVLAHGSEAETLAAQYTELLRRWAGSHRRRGAARIRYLPNPAAPVAPDECLLPKRHGAVAVRWS
jgi:protein-L-isoaspartate(D-aspartate) O-methyltransferase